jgi:uncharacterized protein YkwD
VGVLDREYMRDQGVADKTKWSDVGVPVSVLSREKRTKLLLAIFWSTLVISLLTTAFFSTHHKQALNCKVTSLVVDVNNDRKFTYQDVGALALQMVTLPLKMVSQRNEFQQFTIFFELKTNECASTKAIVLSGALLLSLCLAAVWSLSLALLTLRYVVKYLMFDALKMSPFGRWRAIVFRYAYPRFVWLVPLPLVALTCVGLTAVLSLKGAGSVSTETRDSQPKVPHFKTGQGTQSGSKITSQSKSDTSGASAPLTYEQRLIQALLEVRRAGCNGRVGPSQPMRHTEGMDLLARLVVDGVSNYEERLKQAKYLAFGGSGVKLTLKSSPEATGREAAMALCSDLMEPNLTVVGVAVTKTSAHVHVAREFNPPKEGQEVEIGQRFLAKINQARQTGYKCGDRLYPAAPPLKLNDLLAKAARLHAEDVFKHPGIGHKGSDGSSPTERAQRVGYKVPVGENLTNLSDRPEDAAQSLLQSPGHCANIMNPDFNEMGLGYFVDATKMPGIVWTQKLGATPN